MPQAMISNRKERPLKTIGTSATGAPFQWTKRDTLTGEERRGASLNLDRIAAKGSGRGHGGTKQGYRLSLVKLSKPGEKQSECREVAEVERASRGWLRTISLCVRAITPNNRRVAIAGYFREGELATVQP